MAGNTYTTKTRVKKHLKIEDADTSFDTTLDELIAGVSDGFDQYAEMEFVQRSQDEYHDGMDVALGIVLDRVPSEDDAERTAMVVLEGGVALVRNTDFFIGLHPARTILKLDGAGGHGNFHFAVGTRNVQVTYLTEFKVTPADIELAATEECARMFKNLNTTTAGGDDRIGVTSKSPEPGTALTYADDAWSPHTRQVLDAYRLNRFI